jgi:hypothetical protein
LPRLEAALNNSAAFGVTTIETIYITSHIKAPGNLVIPEGRNVVLEWYGTLEVAGDLTVNGTLRSIRNLNPRSSRLIVGGTLSGTGLNKDQPGGFYGLDEDFKTVGWAWGSFDTYDGTKPRNSVGWWPLVVEVSSTDEFLDAWVYAKTESWIEEAILIGTFDLDFDVSTVGDVHINQITVFGSVTVKPGAHLSAGRLTVWGTLTGEEGAFLWAHKDGGLFLNGNEQPFMNPHPEEGWCFWRWNPDGYGGGEWVEYDGDWPDD